MDTALKNNPQENLEVQFENERRLQARLEKVGIVTVKLKEKYADREESHAVY